MTQISDFSLKSVLRRTAVAAATVAVCAGASAALPDFTLNTAALAGGSTFTGNNILISDFSTVTNGAGGAFSETGFLSVSAFQNSSGATFIPTGLNSTYGLYFAFSGAGTGSTFTSLTYTLYGYNGTATFGFSGNTPTETATGEVTLAHGSLISGSTGNTGGAPSANVTTTFIVDAPGFFTAPSPFYNMALAAFINTTSEVEAFDGGFRIRQGGGSINFTSTPAIPEPETYALLLGGLAAVGFVARRRRA